jgi:hypothetical protein
LRVTLLVLLLSTYAIPAESFDWKPAAVAIAGQAADTISTQRFLHNGSGCTEGTPLFGPHPSTSTLAKYKAPLVGAAILAQLLTSKSSHKGVRRLGKSLGYGVGLNGAGLAWLNIRRCGL